MFNTFSQIVTLFFERNSYSQSLNRYCLKSYFFNYVLNALDTSNKFHGLSFVDKNCNEFLIINRVTFNESPEIRLILSSNLFFLFL